MVLVMVDNSSTSSGQLYDASLMGIDMKMEVKRILKFLKETGKGRYHKRCANIDN